jgi:hypothetical protein
MEAHLRLVGFAKLDPKIVGFLAVSQAVGRQYY